MKTVSRKRTHQSNFTKSLVKWQFILLLIYCFLILLLPTLLRPYATIPGEESYSLVREATVIRGSGTIPSTEKLSFDGRSFVLFSIMPIVIAAIAFLTSTSVQVLAKFLPLIFGLIIFVILYFLIGKVITKDKLRTIVMLILPLSPPFIYLSYIFNYHALPLLLTLLALLLFFSEKKISLTISIIILALIPFFGWIHAAMAFLSLLVIAIAKKKHTRLLPFILILMLITITLHYLPIIIKHGFANSQILKQPSSNFNFKNTISDFGASFGISLFAIILAAVGLGELWKKKYQNAGIYIILMISIILSIIHLPALFYLNIVIIILAATGVVRILNSKWTSPIIKNTTLILLICGLIFSGLTSVTLLANTAPSQSVAEGLLKLRAKPDGVVLSHPSKGFWILTIAYKPTFIDLNSEYVPNLNERVNDLNSMFYSKDLTNTTKLLQEYNIKYIFLDDPMKSGQVWTRDEEGLLFLLKDSERFKSIYADSDAEVWEYLE